MIPYNEVYRKCVAFLGCLREEYAISGTLFFVSLRIEGTDKNEAYAVTTRHAVENASSRSKDAGIYIRFNERKGTAVWLKTELTSWVFHDDDRVDLAAICLHWDDEDVETLDHFTIGSNLILDDEDIDELKIGLGQDLHFPGLFVRHPGNQANVPIVRTGTLAAMPQELIRTSRGLTKVYLAELRSIGGHSGSPVFANIDNIDHQWMLKDSEVFKRLRQASPLIGVIQGFFPLDKSQFAAFFMPCDSGGTTETVSVNEDYNSGIAAVIPASDVVSLLNQKVFVDARKREAEKLIASRSGPTVET